MRILLRATLRKPSFVLAAACFAALVGLTALPLLRQPGYELATALGLALAFLGGLPAWATVSAARAMPSPPSFASTVRISLGLTALLPLPALVASIAAALLTTPCNPLANAGFVALIVPTAALLAWAVGLLSALKASRFSRFVGWYGLAVGVSAVVTVWPLLAGPQVYAFNAFAGYFPGPIYDESLHVTAALGWARAETVLLAGAAVCAASAMVTRSRGARWGTAALLLGAATLQLFSGSLGLETTTADLDAALGGLRTTAHFRIHYPRERSAREVEQLARDLEFQYARDAAFLGVSLKQPVDAFFYRSAAEKQALVGAAQTDFAKPWLRQFHVQLDPFPQRVAKHELAHVLAGALGSRPFHVCAWAGMLPNPAIIEGLAVATDDPPSALTLPEWAHAMRALHLAPDLRKLLRPTGFFAAPANRAYTVTGAFLRYLVRTYGRDTLRVLYPHGDFRAAYGKNLDALVAEWERTNDAVPIDAHARAVAARRFSQPSLFGRQCARQQAHLREALDATPAAETARAADLTRSLLALDPNDLTLARDLAIRQQQAGQTSRARETLGTLLDTPGLGVTLKAQALQRLATLDAEEGHVDSAGQKLHALIALTPDEPTQRAAEIALAALPDPTTRRAVLAYFDHPQRDDALLNLQVLLEAMPGFAPARYLIGRRLTQAQLAPHALSVLSDPAVAALSSMLATHTEALRLRARDHALRHACAAIDADLARVDAPTKADRAYFADWRARCDFEVKQGWPVLPPPD